MNQVRYYREMKPNWSVVLRVWWLFVWRGSAMAAIAGLVWGIVIGIIGTLLGVDPHVRSAISGVTGFLSGIVLSIVAMRMALLKRYGNFRLAIVRLGITEASENDKGFATQDMPAED